MYIKPRAEYSVNASSPSAFSSPAAEDKCNGSSGHHNYICGEQPQGLNLLIKRGKATSLLTAKEGQE